MIVEQDRFRIRGGFAISRGKRTHAHVVTVTLSDGDLSGRGECTPYARYGETVESVVGLIEELRPGVEAGTITRETLQTALPAGAARNAVDCALWDLDAKRQGVSVASLANVPEPQAIETAFTLSVDTPEAMAKVARDNRHRPLLKVKLAGDGDLERMKAVCSHSGDARIIVDANEAWSPANVWDWLGEAEALGIELVEQPLPADQDAILEHKPHPIPVCADESAHDRAGLSSLEGRYDFVNIKLDKTGGLSEALHMRDQARAMGFGIFVGCMMGSSLAMAPAALLAGGADYVDLDTPLLLDEDRETPLTFKDSLLFPPSRDLWG